MIELEGLNKKEKKNQLVLIYPREPLSSENNRGKKAPALMIAFGLGIEMHEIMRIGEGGDGLLY